RRETFRGLKRAAKLPAYVLAVNEHPLILAQKMRLGLPDGFEVRDAHQTRSTIPRVATAHQSSSFPTGAASRCAVSTAFSTSAEISERHFLSVSESAQLFSRINCSVRATQSCAHGSSFIFAGT